MSEIKLVEAAVNGDIESFGVLCEKYYPALVAIACSVLGDHHLAQDATQSSFAKAMVALPGLRNRNRFGPWLRRICRNMARDMAAMIAIAVVLTRPDEPTEVAQYKPLPAHIATIGRLNMAFRSGGLEAIEKLCERSVRTTGPRPERMTAQQLLKEMEHETEPEKGNDNENHSNNNAFNHHTSA